MANALMQSPDFEGFEKFGHPFGLILYYLFTFVVMVVLLNILIALYNSAYEDIYDNANDEYLALFSQKTMQFVRAPDENVFIAPFNLIEVFLLAIPFEWWMPKKQYERLNDIVMATIYSPLLLVAAVFEQQSAREIRANRARGDDDDDTVEEWEQMADQVDFEADGWQKTVDSAKTNLEVDQTILEVQQLRAEVEKLQSLVLDLTKAMGAGTGEKLGGGNGTGLSRGSTVSPNLTTSRTSNPSKAARIQSANLYVLYCRPLARANSQKTSSPQICSTTSIHGDVTLSLARWRSRADVKLAFEPSLSELPSSPGLEVNLYKAQSSPCATASSPCSFIRTLYSRRLCSKRGRWRFEFA